MENKSCTSTICCSGAKIIKIPRGRQRVIPRMDRLLPKVGDVILYNEKISEGMRTRGHLNLEKRGCMHITSITSSLVCGHCNCGGACELFLYSIENGGFNKWLKIWMKQGKWK